jgi:hypothetical protein
MCLRVSCKKKIKNKKFFLASLEYLKKGAGSGVGSGSISQRYGFRIRIRTKMSYFKVKICI